jgi:PAS domain S-box-containing protein
MNNTGHRECLQGRTGETVGELSGKKEQHRRGARELLDELQTLRTELRAQNDDLVDAHARLEESQEKYRELYDFAPVGYLTLDRESIIREVNLRGSELLGAKRETLIGRCFLFFLTASVRERFRRHQAAVIEEGNAEACEVQLASAQREPVYLRIHSTRGKRASGEVVVRTALTDITESRCAEEALRASERRYRSIVETSQEGVVLLDSERRIVYVNRRMKELLNYDEHEMAGRRLTDFVDKKEKAQIPSIGERRIRGTRERSLIRRDGATVCVLVSMSPMAAGAEGYLEMVTDITQRKVIEEAIRRSEQRYALAQRAAKMGSWDWDMESGRLEWSEGIASLFGVADREFPRNYEELLERIHPDDRPRVDRALRACVETGREYDIEHRVVWPGGSMHWVSETDRKSVV